MWLRRLADQVDADGAPQLTIWSFTLEPGRGVVFRSDGRGCPIWWIRRELFDLAHSEADLRTSTRSSL